MAVCRSKWPVVLRRLGQTRLSEIRGIVSLLIILVGFFATKNILASPWIEAGDEQIRHHLETLADAGLISTPINSWPLMWSNIKADLDKISPSELGEEELWSYRFLKHELRRAMDSFVIEQSIQVSNRVSAIGDFSTDSRERYQSSGAIGYTGDNLAYKVKVSYAHHPADGHSYQADGSYVNYIAGNWVLGAGWVDRWWGPGWESSLILSDNARPMPGIYLQRNLALPFESPLLSWIGPWQLTTFMSEFESNRDYPDAKLWGMRVNIKPFKEFELGMSRTAQWGGKGRPSSIGTFVDLLLGKDNLDDFGANQTGDHSKEPGNQLAGFDWRWGRSFGATSGSIYGQFIGEDEAGYMPSRSIGMAGMEINRLIFDVHTRFSLEAQNTMVYFYASEKRAGVTAYEHGIYQNGYRFHGRALGASTDNDTESMSLRSQLYFRNGHNLNISFGLHRINYDGINAASPAGSLFGAGEQDTNKTQIVYTAPLNDVFLLKLSAFNFSKSIHYDGIDFNTGGFISLNASYW